MTSKIKDVNSNVLNSDDFSFNLLLYVHGKQLMSCWDGQLS